MNIDPRQNRKVSISLVGLPVLLGILWGAHEWLAAHTVRAVFAADPATEIRNEIRQAVAAATQASERAERASMRAERTSDRLESYIRRQAIIEATQQLELLNDQLEDTRLWESANGRNTLSHDRIRDLEQRIRVRRGYIQCLETGRTDCELR